MNMGEVLGNVAAAFLILLIVLMIVVAILTATAIVMGIIMAIRDGEKNKEINGLPDRMMEQAAVGLKEREERHDEGTGGNTYSGND